MFGHDKREIMTHLQLQHKFKEQLRKHLDVEKYFYYKIPDTFGIGGIRPFDGILIYGRTYAIEYKVKRDRVKPHQKYYLNLVKASGGVKLVIKETDDLNIII